MEGISHFFFAYPKLCARNMEQAKRKRDIGVDSGGSDVYEDGFAMEEQKINRRKSGRLTVGRKGMFSELGERAENKCGVGTMGRGGCGFCGVDLSADDDGVSCSYCGIVSCEKCMIEEALWACRCGRVGPGNWRDPFYHPCLPCCEEQLRSRSLAGPFRDLSNDPEIQCYAVRETANYETWMVRCGTCGEFHCEACVTTGCEDGGWKDEVKDMDLQGYRRLGKSEVQACGATSLDWDGGRDELTKQETNGRGNTGDGGLNQARPGKV
jgi:hypothetical protein